MRISRRTALMRSVALLACGLASTAHAQTATYEYDAHGRLTKVTYPDGSTVQYTYDAAGNRTQLVRAGPPPPSPTGSLSANPGTINLGASSALTWASANATSVTIDNGVGAVTPVSGGSVNVSPTATTTYTATISGAGGQITRQATVTVTSFNATIDLASTTGTVNLRTLANNAGYNGAQNATVTFEIESGVVIQGAAGAEGSAGGVAIDTGVWPTGSHSIALTLTIKSGGVVRGGGGGGGLGASTELESFAGGAGGDAIYCRLPMTVNINSGAQAHGGGDGGDGGAMLGPTGGGGGGGGGYPNGVGGNGGGSGFPAGGPGANGTTSGGGDGGVGVVDGNAGSPGSQAGVSGFCVRKNGHAVTVNNSGSTSGGIG